MNGRGEAYVNAGTWVNNYVDPCAPDVVHKYLILDFTCTIVEF